MLLTDHVEANAQHGDETRDARVYRSHAATLRAYHAVDFDDLIARPVALFDAHHEVLYRWQSRLCYLLVDEVQDTTRASTVCCANSPARAPRSPRSATTIRRSMLGAARPSTTSRT